jgi:hypothetical protein
MRDPLRVVPGGYPWGSWDHFGLERLLRWLGKADDLPVMPEEPLRIVDDAEVPEGLVQARKDGAYGVHPSDRAVAGAMWGDPEPEPEGLTDG